MTHLALGSYLTAALQQQHPSPEEGTELLREWWRLGDVPGAFDEMLTSWDMKLKEKESGDYTVGQVWGRVASDYWIVDQVRGQWDQATARVAMALLKVRYPDAMRHLVESAGYGPEVMAEIKKASPSWVCSDDMAGRLSILEAERPLVEEIIRRGLDGVTAVPVKGSKVVRARAVSPLLEAGNMHLNANASWLPGFIDEAAQFPNGDHDDQVDAWSQALSRLSGRGEPAKAFSPASLRLPDHVA
jgi:phage terminase large subunit-like protein